MAQLALKTIGITVAVYAAQLYKILLCSRIAIHAQEHVETDSDTWIVVQLSETLSPFTWAVRPRDHCEPQRTYSFTFERSARKFAQRLNLGSVKAQSKQPDWT
jgi:hypothetical protein